MKNEMIFHEVYGAYFRTVGQIVNAILESNDQPERHGIGYDRFCEIVDEYAFRESSGVKSASSNLLANAIDNNTYQGVVNAKIEQGKTIYSTFLKHKVRMPLTTLEKRWLKTISEDPRVRLFDCKFPDLSDVEPLYRTEDIYYCGQYSLGDDYGSEKYVSIFKEVFKAIKEKRYLNITYASLHEGIFCGIVEPQRLQYSIKEDRFRLFALLNGELRTFNLSRIQSCEAGGKLGIVSSQQYPETAYAEVLLSNRRSTLERFLLYFSNYERRTKLLDNGLFHVRVDYPKQDETEVLVNILSFSPMAKIIAPEEMKEKFIERIQRQKDLVKELRKEYPEDDGREAERI